MMIVPTDAANGCPLLSQQQGKFTEGAMDVVAPDDLPSGLYHYKLQLPKQLPISGKIIKQ
jgi:hypothetical protein